jgi:hypothetical protein
MSNTEVWNNIRDYSRDVDRHLLHRLTQLYPPPPYAKEASEIQRGGVVDEIPQHMFAVPGQRLFPAHTKAATWYSALLAAAQASQLGSHTETVRDILCKTAAYFAIEADVRSLFEKVAADASDATKMLPDTHFALVWVDETGQTQRSYPLRNRYEVKAAADWFGKYRNDFVFRDRQQIAEKILDRIADTGADGVDTEMLAKTAARGFCAANAVVDAWRSRAALSTHAAEKEAAEHMIETLREHPVAYNDQPMRLKLAAVMDEFDRETGLQRHYGTGLARPEEALFEVTEKTANDIVQQHIPLATGAMYAKDDLVRIPVNTLQQWFGAEFTKAAQDPVVTGLDPTNLATLATALDVPGAQHFERMLATAGIEPVYRGKVAFDALEV